jgi:hypothetical protein
MVFSLRFELTLLLSVPRLAASRIENIDILPIKLGYPIFIPAKTGKCCVVATYHKMFTLYFDTKRVACGKEIQRYN